MRQSFSTVILFLSALFLYSCNRTPDLTEDEVYKILNEIYADDTLVLYPICRTPELIVLSEKYGFTDQDKKFIERQKELVRDFKFEPNRLKYFSRRDQLFKPVEVDSNCNHNINFLSFPLISSDRKRVVFKTVEAVGQRGARLYIKQNGHWNFIKWLEGSVQ